MSDRTPAPAKPEGRYHHGDLRQALLTTALDLVDTSGVEALTLRAVAQRLGVSHAAPVYHFPTRAHLLTALAEEGFHRFATALEAALPGDPSERLLRVGQAYLAFAAAHPQHYRIMFGPELVNALVPAEAFQEASSRALRALIESSDDKPGAAPLGTRGLFAWAAVHGLVTLRMGPLLCRLPPEGQAELERGMADVLRLVVSALNGR